MTNIPIIKHWTISNHVLIESTKTSDDAKFEYQKKMCVCVCARLCVCVCHWLCVMLFECDEGTHVFEVLTEFGSCLYGYGFICPSTATNSINEQFARLLRALHIISKWFFLFRLFVSVCPPAFTSVSTAAHFDEIQIIFQPDLPKTMGNCRNHWIHTPINIDSIHMSPNPVCLFVHHPHD